MAFSKVVPLGSVVTIEAKVSRSFNSSMEVYADVYIEKVDCGEREKVNEGIYTFVAVDENRKTVKVPELVPETKLEKSRYKNALRRRQLSLLLSGKIKPEEATELKSLFY